ncbi:hypothetical protein HaLaN_17027, partial [Haematococcus lacustris]
MDRFVQARLVCNTSKSATSDSANTSSAGNSSGDNRSSDDGSANNEELGQQPVWLAAPG